MKELYNAIDGLFGDFFYADMETRRCDTHMCCFDEAMFYIKRDAERVGMMLNLLLEHNNEARAALEELKHVGSDELVTDPVENYTFKAAKLLEYMVCKYQLDEHRPELIRAYVKIVEDKIGFN